MENYVNAELDIVVLARTDTISASINIELGENELQIDRFVSL